MLFWCEQIGIITKVLGQHLLGFEHVFIRSYPPRRMSAQYTWWIRLSFLPIPPSKTHREDVHILQNCHSNVYVFVLENYLRNRSMQGIISNSVFWTQDDGKFVNTSSLPIDVVFLILKFYILLNFWYNDWNLVHSSPISSKHDDKSWEIENTVWKQTSLLLLASLVLI